MRKLYLHIGTEKTGTTSIQAFLDKNRDELLNKGFCLLSCGGVKNQRAIPAYCMDDAHYDDFFKDRQIDTLEKKKEFRKELYDAYNKEMDSLDDSVHSVIITSEHFHSRLTSRDAIQRFKNLISGHFSEIVIICYIREQSALAASLYSTAIVAGSQVDFSAFLSRCTPDKYYYNYQKLLGHWSAVFSSACFNIRIFSKDELYNNDLIEDFCVAVDENLLSFTDRELEIENESLSNMGIMIGRAINASLGRYEKNGKVNQVRRHAIKVVSRFFNGHENNISIEQYKEIRELFRESNQEVNKKYFKDREELFTFKRLLAVDTVINEVQVKALSEVIHGLKNESSMADKNVVLYRDAAILLENIDLKKAYELMKLAQQGRPEGPVIQRKIKEYEGRLYASLEGGSSGESKDLD